MDKRMYIYENIYKINDHTNLINIINNSDCKYTENNNGIFINLNTLDENIINNIYFLVNNEIKSEVEEHICEVVVPENIKSPEIKNNKKENINKICINDFDKEDKEIIEKSKKYKL